MAIFSKLELSESLLLILHLLLLVPMLVTVSFQ